MKVLVFIELSDANRYWGAALPLLRSKGIDASFASMRGGGPLLDDLKEHDVPTYTMGATTSGSFPGVVHKLSALARRERFDLIHACESIPAALSGVSKALARRPVRLFHRQHNGCPQNTRLFHNLANWLSDRTMTCSGSTREYAIRHDNMDETRVRVAYNGIVPLRQLGPEEIAKYRLSLGIPENAIVLSLVSRLRAGKGHMVALEAAEILASRTSRPVHLVFTGAGDHEEEIRKAVAAVSGPTVHMTGNQDDVAPWFGMADINLMPTFAEAFGIAAVEAMSSGRPLIASGVDGLLEVIEDGQSGLLVPPGDANALADSIERLLADRELYERIAKGGIDRVFDRFTMDRMVDGWIDCYNWALSGDN
jgi:glycosyltransferase involved in cell wall biosynthesis